MKPFLKINSFLMILGAFFFSAAASAGEIPESRLSEIVIGMKPEQVISILGEPEFRRDDGFNAEGKSMEILEYNILKHIDPAKEPNLMGNQFVNYTCSLMFADKALVRIDRKR